MKKNLITVFGAALLVGLAATAQAQVTIFSEHFDPLSPGNNVQDGYNFGDTTAHSSGVVSGAGVGGTAGWRTVNTASSGANGFSGVGGQYQEPTASGNTASIKVTIPFHSTPGPLEAASVFNSKRGTVRVSEVLLTERSVPRQISP